MVFDQSVVKRPLYENDARDDGYSSEPTIRLKRSWFFSPRRLRDVTVVGLKLG
jgi:hypothetical protein